MAYWISKGKHLCKFAVTMTAASVPRRHIFLLLLGFIPYFIPETVSAQDSILQLPEKYLGAVEKRITNLQSHLDKKTTQYLTKFQKAEAKLLRKLAKKDSTKAAQLLTQSQSKYQQLEQALKSEKPLQEYIPSLDTLVTSLKFLSTHQELLSKTKEAQEEIANALDKVESLKSSLGKAEAVN